MVEGSTEVENAMQQVIPNLFISSSVPAYDQKALEANKITHILCLGPANCPFPELFSYKKIDIEDVPESNILEHLEDTYVFIESAIKAEGTVLVHCMAGISRSATVVIAYLMKSQKLTLEEAYDTVRAARSVICPNPGFYQQLRVYEELGYMVSKENPVYRRFLIENRWRVSDIASIPMGPDPEKLRAANALAGRRLTPNTQRIYKCKKCRRALVTTENIIPHTPGQGQSSFSHHKRDPAHSLSSSQLCTSFFVEPMDWFGNIGSDGEGSVVAGRIDCPKCGAKLGAFNWSGDQCSCGSWVVPAFAIHRNRVDEGVLR
ncbi:uncharacterized protein VTP21DRAFT_6781 [Calcarisporiella thermophila]|uniref:uncharacterized protein n=1 Tax=Calcarisporiella thermophila TaxID=911321 RepID=UPI00374244AF